MSAMPPTAARKRTPPEVRVGHNSGSVLSRALPLSRRCPRVRLFGAIERSDYRLREPKHLITVVATDEGEMSWLPSDWIGRGICVQQRRVFSLLDINPTVLDSSLVSMIGYRVDHFIEPRINLAGHFDAVSTKTWLRSHDNEVEHATPKALVENVRRPFNAVDHRRIRPPSESGIREQGASTPHSSSE